MNLAAIGGAGHDRRAVLAIEDLPQPGEVVGQRRERELRRDTW